MINILQKENKILRQKAKEVPKNLFGTKELNTILSNMKKALEEQSDGVAVAAPQIGISYRIFVVSGKVFDPLFRDDRPIEDMKKRFDDVVFINPVLTKKSKKTKFVPEGCLSVRWLYGNVERSTQATVSAYDANGKKFTRGGGGVLAQIFQHEIDHLDGTLFIDKASDLEEIFPDQNSKSQIPKSKQ